MKLRTKIKAPEPYDLWNVDPKLAKKSHPCLKRNKKNPLPHPGQSYNPDPEEHKRLLKKIAEKELVHQKRQANLNKAVKVKVDSADLRNHEKEELVSGIKHLIKSDAVASGISNEGYDSDSSATDAAYSDYDEKDFEAIVKDKTVKEKRKSRQQRLRQMKDRLQRQAAKLRKLKNIRLSKFDSLKKMSKELDKKLKEEAAKRKTHKKIKNERLGQKFEQSDPIYCLASELPSNLRQVSCPMDKIVREQLESFQARLMVEPTSIQVKKRKYKRKEYERKVAAEDEA